MSHDDMPTFGQPEEQKQKAETTDDMPRPVTRDLPPETGLSVQDQKEAVAKVFKLFAILAAFLIGIVFLYKGGIFAWHKYDLFKTEAALQKILDEKLIEVERTKYIKQYDDWVAQVQPDYDLYYPQKSEDEFQKLIGSHKFLMKVATARLDFVEGQIKRVLASPEKNADQIREAMSLCDDWQDQAVIEAERQAVDEKRLVKQYFAKIAKIKSKEELTPSPAPPVPATVEKPVVVTPIDPNPTPAAKPAVSQVIKQTAPTKKQPQESAADRQYLEEIQKTMRTK